MKGFRDLLLLSLALVGAPACSQACALRTEVVSLSAPVSALLDELGLLRDKNLVAVSAFHPLRTKTSARVLGGGLFLATKEWRELRSKVIYYDESRELAEKLAEEKARHAVKVSTRGIGPFELSQQTLNLLRPQLEGCEVKARSLEEEWKKLRQELLARTAFDRPIYFFLGEWDDERWPELLMANDGPVRFWRSERKLVTIESELAYVRWGEKWRRSLAKNALLIGLANSTEAGRFELKRQGRGFTLSSAEALSPGPAQLRFMRRFVEHYDAQAFF